MPWLIFKNLLILNKPKRSRYNSKYKLMFYFYTLLCLQIPEDLQMILSLVCFCYYIHIGHSKQNMTNGKKEIQRDSSSAFLHKCCLLPVFLIHFVSLNRYFTLVTAQIPEGTGAHARKHHTQLKVEGHWKKLKRKTAEGILLDGYKRSGQEFATKRQTTE